MTRGTLFYYESEDNVWSSCEYNGDMYHGTPGNPQGVGDEVIELMSRLNDLKDFERILKKINKHYEYEEGNESYSINKKAIEEDIKATIKWVDEERPDLKGSDLDPRTWKSKPTFNNVRTWHYWGMPNLSDYSYIYNNSGKYLILATCNKDAEMIIPDGALGVLNYGYKDCVYKDGKLVETFEREE